MVPDARRRPSPRTLAVKAVLFDLDGTLADSASDLAGAINRIRRERGLQPVTVASMRPYASAGARGCHETIPLAGVPRTYTYMREYADKPNFMTLVSDGERITGAYALGPEAGEWLQQATLAIRARVPLEVMNDVIQPFPTFSEAFLNALTDLGSQAAASR